MDVPANRARLTPSELEILDLDDDALIMIINKLNHESKKQMMATSKRFEGLIGHTHQFCKNFKFRYNRRRFPEYRYLGMVRINFKTVQISGGEELSPSILKLQIQGRILHIILENQRLQSSCRLVEHHES